MPCNHRSTAYQGGPASDAFKSWSERIEVLIGDAMGIKREPRK